MSRNDNKKGSNNRNKPIGMSVSETGGRKETKAEAFHLLPWESLEEVARVYHFGTLKYEPHNWRRGIPYSLLFAAAMRHLSRWYQREDIDPESGLNHLAHAAFHLLGLLAFELGPEDMSRFDDRPYPPREDDVGEDAAAHKEGDDL